MNPASFLRKLLGGGQSAVERRTRELVGLCEGLLAERGEYTSTGLARDALAVCQALDERSRDEFFDVLARHYSPSPEAVSRSAAEYQADPSPANLARLQETVEPPRQELFRRLNMAPGGTATLVDMRRQLLKGMKAHPHWRVIDYDLMHLLRSWFNRGFLRLERIDWRTSAIVLEKLIAYEAVHAIDGWDDLRRRLEADRRCFGFFHRQLPDEPLIFIEVALTRTVSSRVQPLLDVRAPVAGDDAANCAMFYSITNCQDGLRGISFGNFLIKQVAQDLRAELPRLRRFATLSPIPGFRDWLDAQRERLQAGPRGGELRELFERLDGAVTLADWARGEVGALAERMLMPLCAQYLVHARRGGSSGEPLDPVARFHLSNGAVLERLNWLGDTSAAGMQRSCGMMVNYVYRLAEVEHNHELYVNQRRVLASRGAEQLAACGAELLAQPG
jgi:malonyl-CoA decarboxylase